MQAMAPCSYSSLDDIRYRNVELYWYCACHRITDECLLTCAVSIRCHAGAQSVSLVPYRSSTRAIRQRSPMKLVILRLIFGTWNRSCAFCSRANVTVSASTAAQLIGATQCVVESSTAASATYEQWSRAGQRVCAGATYTLDTPALASGAYLTILRRNDNIAVQQGFVVYQ